MSGEQNSFQLSFPLSLFLSFLYCSSPCTRCSSSAPRRRQHKCTLTFLTSRSQLPCLRSSSGRTRRRPLHGGTPIKLPLGTSELPKPLLFRKTQPFRAGPPVPGPGPLSDWPPTAAEPSDGRGTVIGSDGHHPGDRRHCGRAAVHCGTAAAAGPRRLPDHAGSVAGRRVRRRPCSTRARTSSRPKTQLRRLSYGVVLLRRNFNLVDNMSCNPSIKLLLLSISCS